jgi:hypothetical protein
VFSRDITKDMFDLWLIESMDMESVDIYYEHKKLIIPTNVCVRVCVHVCAPVSPVSVLCFPTLYMTQLLKVFWKISFAFSCGR